MRAGPTADVNKLTLPAQARKRDDAALATTSIFAKPVDDTDCVKLSCGARLTSTAESNCALARARRLSSRVRTPSQNPNVAHVRYG